MRLFLMLVFAACAAGTAWVFFGMKTSYSGLSDDQLTLLEVEVESVAQGRNRRAAEEAEVSRSIIQDERRRRALRLPALGATAGVLLVTVLLSFVYVKRSLTDEELRLVATVGNPNEQVAARHRAAERLGVTVDAPPQVIEAAYEAQLKLHDPSRMDGLSEDLREVARRKLDELKQARELLLRNKSAHG